MTARILICFPIGDAPGLQTEAAQLAFGLTALGQEVVAFGALGPWRHPLRLAHIAASESMLTGEDDQLIDTLQALNPRIIHAFGAEAAHALLPLAFLMGAAGVATLGHADLPRLNPAQFRDAARIFVPCDYLREQVARRLPAVSVTTTGYLLTSPPQSALLRTRLCAEEIGVRDGAPVVLLADHFHGSETEIAQALIAATPLIADHLHGVQLVVAGGGMRLPELEGQAIEVNTRLGYRAVLLPGQRGDIQQLLSLATVAVGCGRFAMEAVGAGVALIAAGAAGLIGTYTEETAKVASFTCCGRHGHLEPVSPRLLASEVVGLFQHTDYRERFAREGQNTVLAQQQREMRAEQMAACYREIAPAGNVAPHAPQRIAVILPESLRELLFTLPAIAALREYYSQAQISLLSESRHVELLRQFQLAERVLPRPCRLRDWPRVVRALFHPRPDVCLTFTDDAPSAFLAGCSFATHRLGFSEGGGSLLLSNHLQTQTPDSPHRAAALVHSLGITACPLLPIPELPLATQETVHLSLLAVGIGNDEPLILLCPQNEAPYAWHPEHWNTLARRLAEERDERLVLLGAEGLALPPGVIQVAPVSDSLTLAALLARASLVVAPDSGILHLADLLQVPTIGLYGPTSPDICALPNAHRTPMCHREFSCHPCGEAPCEERHCLRALQPAEVYTAISAVLWERGHSDREAIFLGAVGRP